MSLGLAINSALGGLRLTSVGTRLVAENLANAEMPDFGPRRLVPTGNAASAVSGRQQGGAIQRNVDPMLLAGTRTAESDLRHAQTHLEGLKNIETALGLPGEPGSLHARIVSFETSLRGAAASPESTAALQAVAQDAQRIAQKFNSAETQIQSVRQHADAAIAQDVANLNIGLQRVVSLNEAIQRHELLGGDSLGLMDERQNVISQIAALIPVTEIPRANGRIMLVSDSGIVLADQDPARFAFSPSIGISAADSLDDGALSGLSVNGRALSADNLSLSGGRIAANLTLRDQIAPDAQRRLDLLAKDLLTRFSGPDADPTLPPNRLGLFGLANTDTPPATTKGLAGMMRVSPLVASPDAPDLWRLRSGLQATSPGPVGDTSNLTRLVATVEHISVLAPGGSARNFVDHVADQASEITTRRLGAEDDVAFSQAQHRVVTQALAAQGVDTDHEMQKLLELEQAYAANARVLSTINDMMRTLLEI